MKLFLLTLLFVLTALAAHAQTPPLQAQPNKEVIVLATSWRFELRNPMMEQDPMREAKMQEERGLAQARSVTNTNPHRPAILTDTVSGKSSEGNPSGIYVYEIKVKNIGRKAISGIELDYVFVDRATNLEANRLKLSSSSHIGAGKTKNLVFRSVSPPAGAIHAGKPTGGTKWLYLESVVIESIRFTRK